MRISRERLCFNATIYQSQDKYAFWIERQCSFMWHDKHERYFSLHSSSFFLYNCRKHDKQRQDFSILNDRNSQIVQKEKISLMKRIFLWLLYENKKTSEHLCTLFSWNNDITINSAFQFVEMKIMKYAHVLFNDMKLIIESTIINKITIVLKFVMLFCLKIINVINHINHFRVLIYTLNNATINNLIERFNQRLQK